MKHLSQYIIEGLFDIQNAIDKNPGTVLDDTLFNNIDSNLWKFCIPCLSNGEHVYDLSEIEKSIDIGKGTIEIWSDVRLDTKYKNPLSKKYSLSCNMFYIGDPLGRGPHPEPVLDGAGFDEINCDGVAIDGFCKKVDGFNFNIRATNARGRLVYSARVNWASDVEITDTEFNFEYPNGWIIFNECSDFPELGGIKTNANCIKMYDPSLFDQSDIKTKLDKFFGNGEIIANGITKKKSLRNIVAIANNMRKYNSLDPRQIVPVGKVSDLLDLRGFKDLKEIHMYNNNVVIFFYRPGTEKIMHHARFVRMNNMKEFKDYSLDDMMDVVNQCTTADGWVVCIQPKYF